MDYMYKCWDKKSKKLRDVECIVFHSKHDTWYYCPMDKPKLINVWGFNVITQQDMILNREPKDVELLLCSNLKDKNNKFIYEGHIVQIGDIKGVVIFRDSGFFIEQEENDLFLGQYPQSEIEIIGNVYENFNLL